MVEGNPCTGDKEQILSFCVWGHSITASSHYLGSSLFAELWSSHGVGSFLPGYLEILANLDLVSHQ